VGARACGTITAAAGFANLAKGNGSDFANLQGRFDKTRQTEEAKVKTKIVPTITAHTRNRNELASAIRPRRSGD
jgi:hypothetical protein